MLENLAQYRILDRIGAGGMGEVYRARDTRLGRTVAVKVLAADVADDPVRRDRFLREARASAALSHPNIAALYEIGDDQGRLFLAFEYVPGDTLDAVIAGRPLNPRRAIDLAVQLADALADAHASGIVHRDIKPANVVVTPKGAAKILDFGLATWTSGGAERDRAADAETMMATGRGTALGTVAYMSPEQALGKPVDHRTDIFSLGIVLFEMLTGRRPFTAATPTAMGIEIVQTRAPSPSSVNAAAPKELDAIAARALAKNPDHRYDSAAVLAAELRAAAAALDARREMPVSAAEAPGQRHGAAARRRRFGAAIAIAAVVAIAAGAGWIGRHAIQRAWRRSMARTPAPIIAVLPLELEGGDASQTYFADGLTEDLISRLGQTPGLKVLGRSATRGLRGRAPTDVARELGASVVLAGTVRPAGDALKVSLELIDPTDRTAMWAQQYTLDVKDVFAVQARVAKEVAAALRVALRPTAATVRAESRLVDQRAYDLYLRGRQAAADRRLDDAIRLFEEAISVDAGLAEAYAGLAEVLELQEAVDGKPVDAVRLRAAAERAYQLDEDLPAANLAMGLAQDSLADTLKYMRRAVDRDASFAEAYHQIGDQIQDFAPDLSVSFYRRSLELDPRLAAGHSDLIVSFMLLDRVDEARREYAISPGVGPLLDIAVNTRRYDEGLAALERFAQLRTPEGFWPDYVALLESAGRKDDALREGLALASRMPSCAVRALVSGLRREHGDAAAARQLADPIVRDAVSPSATPENARCGARAAAAMGDAPAFAAILDNIAAREDRLRHWALQISGETGGMCLKGRLYPFDRVVGNPAIAAARGRLDAAYARERDVARSVLAGLLQR